MLADVAHACTCVLCVVQFRSFSQQLTGTQDHHMTLRQKAVDRIR